MGISDRCLRLMHSKLEQNKRTELQEYDSSCPIKKQEEDEFIFAIFADPQVSNYMFARETCFYQGCRDISNASEPIDALVIAGDITENGMKCEFRMVADLLNSISSKVNHFFLIPGNHDIRMRPYKKQLKSFRSFTAGIKNAYVPETKNYCHSYDFPLCRFIMMGSDKASFEGAYISESQLNWLDSEITKAENEGKPAFVFNHQALKNTNGLPDTWQTNDNYRGSIGNENEKVRAVFEKHSNVIFITGHLHCGFCKTSYEDYGSFKALTVPTIGAGNHGEYGPDVQGYIITVSKSKITIKGRLFGYGIYAPESIPCTCIEIER